MIVGQFGFDYWFVEGFGLEVEGVCGGGDGLLPFHNPPIIIPFLPTTLPNPPSILGSTITTTLLLPQKLLHLNQLLHWHLYVLHVDADY